MKLSFFDTRNLLVGECCGSIILSQPKETAVIITTQDGYIYYQKQAEFGNKYKRVHPMTLREAAMLWNGPFRAITQPMIEHWAEGLSERMKDKLIEYLDSSTGPYPLAFVPSTKMASFTGCSGWNEYFGKCYKNTYGIDWESNDVRVNHRLLQALSHVRPEDREKLINEAKETTLKDLEDIAEHIYPGNVNLFSIYYIKQHTHISNPNTLHSLSTYFLRCQELRVKPRIDFDSEENLEAEMIKIATKSLGKDYLAVSFQADKSFEVLGKMLPKNIKQIRSAKDMAMLTAQIHEPDIDQTSPEYINTLYSQANGAIFSCVYDDKTYLLEIESYQRKKNTAPAYRLSGLYGEDGLCVPANVTHYVKAKIDAINDVFESSAA